jgi:hypothetical protein
MFRVFCCCVERNNNLYISIKATYNTMYKYEWKFKYRNVYFDNDKQNVHNIKVITMCKQWWSTI